MKLAADRFYAPQEFLTRTHKTFIRASYETAKAIFDVIITPDNKMVFAKNHEPSTKTPIHAAIIDRFSLAVAA